MSADVQLDDVWIRFGDYVAAKEANIHIKEGEFFSFLGPSGCGKTTLLRAVSGFLEPSQGRVLIGGKDMDGIGPNKRPTALIFQNLALFPLMTVWENVAFALEVQGINKKDRRKKADELLEMVALGDQGDKMPDELSGGQKQRVAIARALAAEPDVLLLDEPLSALDLKLRQHMRTELREIQQRVGITFIYITHDQGEALTMSDNVAVMSQAVIEQIGDGNAVYNHPETAFVASFVGENNLFSGKVIDVSGDYATVDTASGQLQAINGKKDGKAQLSVGDDAYLFVRPESLVLVKDNKRDNSVQAKIENQEFEGNFWQVFCNVKGSKKQIKMSLINSGGDLGQETGDDVLLGFNADQGIALPKGQLAAE
ncbi:MAG: ABC transporter ATP-binding protein [Cocleimonas sp.]